MVFLLNPCSRKKFSNNASMVIMGKYVNFLYYQAIMKTITEYSITMAGLLLFVKRDVRVDIQNKCSNFDYLNTRFDIVKIGHDDDGENEQPREKLGELDYDWWRFLSKISCGN